MPAGAKPLRRRQGGRAGARGASACAAREGVSLPFLSPPPSSPEAVKDLVGAVSRHSGPDFHRDKLHRATEGRRSERSERAHPVFPSGLQMLWTPVYTGETNTVGFFHSFPPAKGGKIFAVIQTPYNS